MSERIVVDMRAIGVVLASYRSKPASISEEQITAAWDEFDRVRHILLNVANDAPPPPRRLFRRRSPDQRIASALARILERESHQHVPDLLHVQSLQVSRVLRDGRLELDINLRGRA